MSERRWKSASKTHVGYGSSTTIKTRAMKTISMLLMIDMALFEIGRPLSDCLHVAAIVNDLKGFIYVAVTAVIIRVCFTNRFRRRNGNVIGLLSE